VLSDGRTPGRITADVDGSAGFTVRIRRLVSAPHRHWRLIRTGSFSAGGVGRATYDLPALGPGTYRLNIHESGMPEGDGFVRTLTVR
jgi:hypothetical protein